jgi:high-affinity nickel permease
MLSVLATSGSGFAQQPDKIIETKIKNIAGIISGFFLTIILILNIQILLKAGRIYMKSGCREILLTKFKPVS